MKIISRQDAIRAGLMHYYTGKPCRNGHQSHRYTTTGGCKECIYQHNAAQRREIRSIREKLTAGQTERAT